MTTACLGEQYDGNNEIKNSITVMEILCRLFRIFAHAALYRTPYLAIKWGSGRVNNKVNNEYLVISSSSSNLLAG
jgi:hypothetical protein